MLRELSLRKVWLRMRGKVFRNKKSQLINKRKVNKRTKSLKAKCNTSTEE
jgi:hypothetical protein